MAVTSGVLLTEIITLLGLEFDQFQENIITYFDKATDEINKVSISWMNKYLILFDKITPLLKN